jgi:hypothetical protein
MDERNIYNVDELEDWLKFRASYQRGYDARIDDWVMTTARNYALNNYPHVQLVTDRDIQQKIKPQDRDAEWVQRGIRQKNLYVLILGVNTFSTKFSHILDYLQSALTNRDLPDSLRLKNLTHLSYEAAEEKSNEWTKWLNRGESKDWEEGEEEVMKTSDGFKIVKVISQAALNREGKEMQHCVGSYADLVRNKRVTIYSLRDRSNNPHVTIEVDREDTVKQIKGKQNDAPIEKYHNAVIEFLNWLNPNGALELENIDGVDYEGRFYHISKVPPSYWTGDDDGIDRLMGLVASNKLNLLESILKTGVSPNVTDRYGHTMLYYACSRKDGFDVVKALLSYGADPNAKDAPILAAAGFAEGQRRGRRDVVNFLIANGADVTITAGNDTNSLIHHCVNNQWHEEVEYILRHGEKVDVRNYYDKTPLMMAAANNDLLMVKMLLKYGADPTKGDDWDRTPLDYAKSSEVRDLLTQWK